MQSAKQHSRLPVDLSFGSGWHRQVTGWLAGQCSEHYGPQARVGSQQHRRATWPEFRRPMPLTA